MPMKKPLTILLLHSVPAGLFLSFVFSMRGEYYFASYLLMGLAFLAASLVSAGVNLRRIGAFVARPRAALSVALTVSWFFSVVVLAISNMTPLCVGQDNGDGNNGVGECVLYTILAGVFYTLGATCVIAAVSLAGGWIIRRSFPNPEA